jgi:enoyl-CoA hydratase/carnithine racemase
MSWSLSQSLPPQLVTEILMEGKPISAARLHQHGIINRVVSDGQALNAALDWSDELARQSPHSISSIKSLVREASTATLPAQLKSEQHAFVECLHHRDALEGMTAFLEKRKPNYS